jgi:SAM-dependent methyltransferase
MASISAFTGYVPEYYERRMVPLLFSPYADELVARVPARDGLRVLELACGTGVVTRKLREALPASASLVATDLNQAMTDYASSVVPAAGIDWRVADMQALPFEDGSFDVVVCQYGFMFPPDKPQAFREVRRVLAPGGVLLANVWGSLDENPAMDVMNRALVQLYPDDPPRFFFTPYGYARDRVAADIAAAGWDARLDDVNLDVDCLARDIAEGYVRGSPLSHQLAERGADPEAVIGALVEALRGAYGDERFVMKHSAFVITAGA